MGVRHVQRKEFILPRCTEACPAGVDVPRYIRAVKDQNYDEAVAVLREKLPLPTVCADACFAPCEDVCAYKQFGDPIAIRAIKRAAVDKGGDTWKKRKKVADKTGKKVAVVGSKPAGLSPAYYLATKGHGESSRKNIQEVMERFKNSGQEEFLRVNVRNERTYMAPVRDNNGNLLGYFERFELNLQIDQP
ncbi:MAG: hypothetical protein ISS59_02195 [Desulfobacteraceae bacterium]|nr:hypothetical protein [Desulfobacteraceae bacterium]